MLEIDISLDKSQELIIPQLWNLCCDWASLGYHYFQIVLVLNFPLNGKNSAQPHTIVKQICFPNGSVLFLSVFSLPKN